MSVHQCSRCRCMESVFWLPLDLGANDVELCDDCMFDLIKFIEGHAVDKEKMIKRY